MRYAVFEYGCRSPLAGEDVALEQMRRRIDFWNALVAIEQEHIVRTRELLGANVADDRIAAFRKELAELVAALRARSGTSAAERRDLRTQIEALKASMKEAILEARQLRRQAVEERRAALSEIDPERKAAVKLARASAGLYWCNADEVIALYEEGRIRAMKNGTSVGSREWRGTGTVSVKYQRGLAPADITADTRFQIDPVDPQAWDHPCRAVRRRLCRTVARIRVGSTERRTPVWLEVPIVMHRPLPEDVLIRTVKIKRFRVGTEYRYKLLITVRGREPATLKRSSEPRRVAGICLDVRHVVTGIHLGDWVDTAGESGQLVLPIEIVSQFDKIDHIRSRIDRNWNDMRAELLAWLGTTPIPDWLRDATKELRLWSDYRRPLQLVESWRAERFDGDDAILAKLMAWRQRHIHLYSWTTHLRDQVQTRRREHYRLVASELARRFDLIVLATADFGPSSAGTDDVGDSSRRRTIAAMGILKRTLTRTCKREGVEIRSVQPVPVQRVCPACGAADLAAADRTLLKCQSCGQAFDSGRVDAEAILRLGLAASE
jgi:hypothetical protein